MNSSGAIVIVDVITFWVYDPSRCAGLILEVVGAILTGLLYILFLGVTVSEEVQNLCLDELFADTGATFSEVSEPDSSLRHHDQGGTAA